jgi:hypothetical protein
LVKTGKFCGTSCESLKILSKFLRSAILLSCNSVDYYFFPISFTKSSMFKQELNISYHNCYQSTSKSVNELEKQENLLNFRHIFFIYNITQQIINMFLSFEKNQRFLLNFGALSSNLFLYCSQHIRFLR